MARDGITVCPLYPTFPIMQLQQQIYSSLRKQQNLTHIAGLLVIHELGLKCIIGGYQTFEVFQCVQPHL